MIQTARLSGELEHGIDILGGERSLTGLGTASVLGFLMKGNRENSDEKS